MLAINVVFGLLAVLPSTLAALPPGSGNHGTGAAGHQNFQSPPEQAEAALLDRSVGMMVGESEMDAALYGQNPGAELLRDEAIVTSNLTRLDTGGKARAEPRALLKNPKRILNPKWTPSTTTTAAATTRTTTRKTTTTTTRAATTTTATTQSPAASSGARTCRLTADCTGQPAPPNGHVYCNQTVSACSFRCNKNYVVFGNGCVRADSVPTTVGTTLAPTTTTSNAVPVLPPQPTGNCQTLYRDTSGGAIYGPGLGTFPMLPRPSTFVTRQGSGLWLDGKVYRTVGPNIYWLGLEENVYPSPSYPDRGRVREAMAMAVGMGANTVRSHTLGISTGTSLSIWPSAYTTNSKAFESIDYAIWAARNYGLRLIIPLTDEHAYYHGGKYDFIRWAGGNTNNGYSFYTNEAVINLFKEYIKVVLNHVNQYTGVAYKNDPTIMAWETGNELGAYMLGAGAPPAVWTNNIGNYIKGIAPNQLVADGTDGLVDYGGSLQNTGVAVAPVDMVTDHFYPALSWLLQKDAGLMQYYTKNFFVGEMDWTYSRGGDDPSLLYSFLEAQPYSGSMAWSLFGHDAQCCNWVYHNDGYSIYPPNGMSDYLQAQFMKLVQHYYRMRGLTPPAKFPAIACPQPELLP